MSELKNAEEAIVFLSERINEKNARIRELEKENDLLVEAGKELGAENARLKADFARTYQGGMAGGRFQK